MHPILAFACFALAAMTLAWAVQQRTRVAGYVDVVWAFGVGAGALWYAWEGTAPAPIRAAAALMGALWGLRLGSHLLARLRHEREDGRYAHMRRAIGDHAGKWYAFFLFQALLTVLFSLPFWVVANNDAATRGLLVPAALIWLLSVAGESVADHQLARFRADPASRGKVCTVGLWRYSRHPNYFFEWLHWFAYVVLSLGSPHWWLSLAGAALMLASLLWVTGIPFVEQQSLRTRGEAYREYQRSTSMFVPWPPKRRGAHGA